MKTIYQNNLVKNVNFKLVYVRLSHMSVGMHMKKEIGP
jgi:hypothetical protein